MNSITLALSLHDKALLGFEFDTRGIKMLSVTLLQIHDNLMK